ncbi:MAG TPA: hypothetical protein PK796_05470 [Bacteroidales bacterium]|jgi:hypothetical protein|nr:hypothetical protein [Bacteroidales bacterium]
MQNTKFKMLATILRSAILSSVVLMADALTAQNLRAQLQQCPVTIENGKINYYMPQQAGPYFQLPPARKPQYVIIMTVPWVQPLTKSVKETQSDVLQSLHEFILQSHQNNSDKELFLRKLAWCVMLNTSIAKQVDTGIRDYINQLTTDEDSGINTKAALVQKLVNDYRSNR